MCMRERAGIGPVIARIRRESSELERKSSVYYTVDLPFSKGHSIRRKKSLACILKSRAFTLKQRSIKWELESW